MPSLTDILDSCRVLPGKKIRLKNFDPSWAGDRRTPKTKRKKLAEKLLTETVQDLAVAQELLFASDTWSILVVLQAMDTAGKDSTIKHVMSGVNPQGCEVHSFKHPTPEELDHTYLWRCMKVLPERGHIGIFNRSYYEDVLVVKVHPELVVAERIPNVEPSGKLWNQRYEDINNFERHLVRNGTKVLKFYLNISKNEQRKRFLDRIEDPKKHWKFSADDMRERSRWDDYQQAYEEALSATSTKEAPWYVIPGNHKWVSRALVATILTETIHSLELKWPTLTPEKRKQLKEAKRLLETGKESRPRK